MDKDYKYTRTDLERAINRSRWTLIRWEKEGRFTPYRTVGGWRMFTAEQIEEIKQAFGYGGSKEWHAKPSTGQSVD
jgi:hypothetical protein